ncbi:MAG TPA: hypothetical protein ENJ12_09835 [Thiolapillus brandeum]|uniref:Letm1 RBD domain-containing protein n=1 Tax=Thiolapillus brandeum TaxID=1076588 RepID=A0A831W8R2_9GAMM|nr:hypothetical protein [Thiolapillus brandeum]
MSLSSHHIDARQLLEHLEEHWREKYTVEELHAHLHHMLLELKDILEENTENTKLFTKTYLRFATGEKLSHEEMQAANHALAELLKYLGMAVIGILPGAFITLPGLYALANHFNVDLLPEISPGAKQGKPS